MLVVGSGAVGGELAWICRRCGLAILDPGVYSVIKSTVFKWTCVLITSGLDSSSLVDSRLAPVTVLAIAIQKGGVGKTSTLVGLAEMLVEMGREVLVVDLDAQSNASRWLLQVGSSDFEEEAGTTLRRALRAQIEGEELVPVHELVTSTPVGVDLVPADPYMGKLIKRLDDPRFLQRIVDEVEEAAERGLVPSYDFILVDTPPHIGFSLWVALAASDGVVIPVQLEGPSIEGLNAFLDAFNQARSDVNPDLDVVGIFANQVDVRRRTAEQGWDFLRETYGEAVFNVRLRQRAAIAEAATAKRSILESGGDHVNEAFHELAKEVIRRT